jgi:parallel beta-helix repeat protein
MDRRAEGDQRRLRHLSGRKHRRAGDGFQGSGASDAGIYVGQSRDITVRNNIVEYNVAGIEIENSRNALVENNIATRNTGGLLVFDLPGLPVMNGGNVILRRNVVVDNDTPNFAPPGNIVASVRRGTGVLVMANDGVLIEEKRLDNNPTAHVMVVAYTQAFEDARYNPYARNVIVGPNAFGRGGDDPQLDGKEQCCSRPSAARCRRCCGTGWWKTATG